MSLLLLFPSVAASGAGTATPAGVEMVMEIGQVVATGGAVVPVPIVAVTGGGGGGGGYAPSRRTWAKQQRTRAAEAEPDGVEMVAEVGQVIASGGASVAVCGVTLAAEVGQVKATGIQNLSDEAWILLIDEAA
jgi:hypothetical protein